MRKKLVFVIILLGFSGIIAQALLLREFLIRFSGNELSIGIILANWLMLEAIGVFFLGKRIEYTQKRIEFFIILQLFFSFSLPVVIYLVRILNIVIHLTPGEGIGIVGIFYSSFLLLIPVCIPHGALFTAACAIYNQHNAYQKSDTTIGRVYMYDALGILIGGAIFTFLFIRWLNSFQIAAVVSLLNVLMILAYAKKLRRIIFIFLFINILLLLKINNIHLHSIKLQWPKQNIISYNNSAYGNVAVSEKDNQYTFYSNGVPVFSTPTSDIIYLEEFAHLVLLSHPDPKKILIIRSGAGGLINEVLKHPVERVDYCELDPLIIKTVKTFSTPITQKELTDPRVKINYIDGRFFLKNNKEKYDIIMIGISNPQDLQTNRYFTKEFFAIAKYHLDNEGILAINMPGSSSYLNIELRKFNACILDTLKHSMPYRFIIPGDTNIFLGSSSKELAAINTNILTQRLMQRNLNLSLVTAKYIEYKLNQQRLDWFLDSIDKIKKNVNRDFKPIAVFYGLSYWNSLFSPSAERFFKLLEGIRYESIFAILIIFAASLRFRNQKITKGIIPFVVISTGFAGIAFNLILIFAFQILYGFLYYWIGLLVAAFMAGIAAGSFLMTGRLENMKNDVVILKKTEFIIIIFSIALPFILICLKAFIEFSSSYAIAQMIFFILALISGYLVGMEFPIANKIYLKSAKKLSRTAGSLYASDLLGGWFGGMLVAVVFLPIFGIIKTCILLTALKLSSYIILTQLAEE